jgi:hypothetical protein
MSIVTAELQFFRSATVTDTTANGGRLSATQITSGAIANVFPHAMAAERSAGSTKRRKLFLKCSNDADETLYAPWACLDGPTAADDYVYFHVGTQRDTAADITGSERKYGAGQLKTTVTAGGSTLVVTVENAALTGIFQNGDRIRVTNKATPTSGTGTEEEHVISGAPSVSGVDVTLTLATTLANGYTAGVGTKIASVYKPSADLTCTVDNWVETGAGTYNEATYPVVCDNIGTVEQTWTLTFSDATNYTVVGDQIGSVGSGTVGADFAPSNGSWTKPYFTLRSAGFGGTWAAGNTIVFQTHPAAIAIWETRVIPAGSASLAGNAATLIFGGETA